MKALLKEELPLQHDTEKLINCCNNSLDKLNTKDWKIWLKKVFQNWKTRKQLRVLSQSQIEDLGLSKEDIEKEIKKAPWE